MDDYFLKYPKSTLSKARELRRKMTDAERKLWRLLRHNQLGVHFRRQVPLDPYILDFFCFETKLVVELDGSQHYRKSGLNSDSKRDTYLKKQGLRVLRFNNIEILRNPFGVVQAIYEDIQKNIIC